MTWQIPLQSIIQRASEFFRQDVERSRWMSPPTPTSEMNRLTLFIAMLATNVIKSHGFMFPRMVLHIHIERANLNSFRWLGIWGFSGKSPDTGLESVCGLKMSFPRTYRGATTLYLLLCGGNWELRTKWTRMVKVKKWGHKVRGKRGNRKSPKITILPMLPLPIPLLRWLITNGCPASNTKTQFSHQKNLKEKKSFSTHSHVK